jgi:hypothetical protein
MVAVGVDLIGKTWEELTVSNSLSHSLVQQQLLKPYSGKHYLRIDENTDFHRKPV